MLRLAVMFDALATARPARDVGLDPEHVEAAADAVRQAAEDRQLDVSILATRAELATLEAGLIKRPSGLILVGAGRRTAALFAPLRLLN